MHSNQAVILLSCNNGFLDFQVYKDEMVYHIL